MGQESYIMKMVAFSEGHIWMIRSMALESVPSQVAKELRVPGFMENKKVKEDLSISMVK